MNPSPLPWTAEEYLSPKGLAFVKDATGAHVLRANFEDAKLIVECVNRKHRNDERRKAREAKG